MEFSSTLRVASRDGSILSEVIRKAWDGLPLSNRRSQSCQVVKEHHVSIVGNITREELELTLRRTDGFNGFANRILWVWTERSKKLPFGGDMTEGDWRQLGKLTCDALDAARKVGVMQRSRDADAVWASWYVNLPDDTPGLWGAVTARAEAYVLRLSMIYALMDGQPVIEQRHVEAAIAVWDYCHESAGLIFGDKTGDRDVDKLIDALAAAADRGLNRTQQQALFKRQRLKPAAAREKAIQLGIATEHPRPTATRPEEVLYLVEYAPQIGGQ